MTTAAERVQEPRSRCWCCDEEFPEAHLMRLGAHPEVTVCAGCALFLHRRARAWADEQSPSVGRRARNVVRGARQRVLSRGWHRWPVLGRLLRRLDRHLP